MCVMPAPHPVHDHSLHAEPEGDAYGAFREELVAAGLLVPMGVPGFFGHGHDFEHVIDRFHAMVTRAGVERPALPNAM